MVQRGLKRQDAAASDIVATMLMILGVVVLGSAVSVVVANTFEDKQGSTQAAFSMSTVKEGDAALFVTLQNGHPLAVDALHFSLSRNGTASEPVPRSTWSTALGLSEWSAGEKLRVDLADPVRPDESIVLQAYRSDSNALIATLAARSGFAIAALPAPTVHVPPPSPVSIPADATAASLVTARISHPEGVLAVAEATMDFGSVGGGRLLATLNDQGNDGDARGGDGVWSALVRAPVTSDTGLYRGSLRVTDASGRVTVIDDAAQLSVTATASGGGGLSGGSPTIYYNITYPTYNITYSNFTGGPGNYTGNFSGNSTGIFDGNSTGNFSGNTSGNFSGNSTGNFGGNGTGNWTGNSSGYFEGNSSGNFTGNSSGNFTGNFSGNGTGNWNGNTSGNFNGNGTGNFSGNFTCTGTCSFNGNGTGNFSGNTNGNHTGDVDGAFYGVGAGKRATEGTRFKVPTSANVSKLRMENWTYDRLNPSKLDYDGMVVRVLAGNRSWSVYLKFDHTTENPRSIPKVTSMRMWNNFADTTYLPNGDQTSTPLNLNNLSLNLLDPLGSGQWKQPSGSHPNALYQNSGIVDDPFVVISFLRDERGQGQGTSGQAQETGVYGVDVVFV